MDVEPRTENEDTRGVGATPRTLGRYRIVAELGRGSTSIVYLAMVSSAGGFHKLLALKQLRAPLAADPAMVARFVDEARIGAHLDHPNVVQTLEIEDQDALPYIVMEYLDGQTLQRVTSAARLAFAPMPLHMHLAVLSGAIEGLGYAHAALGYDGAPMCVVHRDVSPHNIFVTCSGQPKILDFGMAQAIDSDIDPTADGGRAAYMSPEQAAGASVDARSDLFAVGIIMWEAITRRRFWPEGTTDTQILNRLTARDLPESRVSALASIPADLRSMIAKATAPDPADRYQSAAAFQVDLQATMLRLTPPAFRLRDLGQRVAGLFASDRTRLQAAVDGQAESARSAMAGDTGVAKSAIDGEATRRSTPRPPAVSRSTPPPGPVAVEKSAPPPPTAGPLSPEPIVRAPPGPLPSFPFPQTVETPPAEAIAASGHRMLAIGVIALSVAAIVALSLSRGHAVEPAPLSPTASPSAASVAPPRPGTAGAVAEPSPPVVDEPWAPVAVAAPDSPSARAEAQATARSTDPPATYPRPLSMTPERPTAQSGWHPIAKPPPAFVAPAPPVLVAPPPASSRPASPAAPGQPPAGVQPSRPIDSLNPYGP